MVTFAYAWGVVRRTPENPRVGGSIPSQATRPKTARSETSGFQLSGRSSRKCEHRSAFHLREHRRHPAVRAAYLLPRLPVGLAPARAAAPQPAKDPAPAGRGMVARVGAGPVTGRRTLEDLGTPEGLPHLGISGRPEPLLTEGATESSVASRTRSPVASLPGGRQ